MSGGRAGAAVDEAAADEVRIDGVSVEAVSMLDARGFDAWVRPHWRSMALLATRLAGPSADDVLAEALLAAWHKRSQFDADRGAPRSWLLAIVADRAYKAHRSTLSRPRTTELSAIAGSDRDVRQDRSDMASKVDLNRAVAMLTDRQQLAITLFYAIGLPIAEVAAVMGCADGTVKSTLRDARAKLRSLLIVEETS
ncbi:RNA polymerase sigma factor [Nakamurella sp. A5-74]|uniref:RNA polymerase sigma factor n=1 Tax=Nakamurella sp. A5-74 TaxID=3158264 RepID=A0AAU8DKH8_9ACTN